MAGDRVVKILQSVYRKIRDLLEIDRFYVALYDPRRGRLEFPLVEPPETTGRCETKVEIWAERPSRRFEPPPNDGVASPMAGLGDCPTEDGALRPRHPSESEAGRVEYWPGAPLPVSWLGVPLAAEDQILGALVVENRRKAGCLRTKSRSAVHCGPQAAIALANAQLREQMERQIARLKALYDMGQRLTASIQLSEQEIIELIYEQASRVMDTKNMYIALYDEATDTVRFALAYRDDRRVDVEKEEGWQPRSGGQGRTEEIIRTRKPLFTAVRADSEAWYREGERKDYIKQPFASWVGVPMIAGDQVLGVIATYHTTNEHVYDEDDEQVLAMIGSQAGVAIENARLLQGAAWVQQLTALQKIGVQITSQLELNEVLGSVVESANSILSADFSTLFPYDWRRGRFEEGTRKPKGELEPEPSIPSIAGLAARIAEGLQPCFVENAEIEPGVKSDFIQEKKIRSFAGVPLEFRGKCVGVLFVNYS